MENNMNSCMLWLVGGLVLGGLIGGVVGYNVGYSTGQDNYSSDLRANTVDKVSEMKDAIVGQSATGQEGNASGVIAGAAGAAAIAQDVIRNM